MTILQQLERKADKLGLSYVNISRVLGSKVKVLIKVFQVGISALKSELAKKPRLILSTIDSFSDSKVKTSNTEDDRSSILGFRFAKS